MFLQANPLATPGFFEQAAIPLGGSSILPGTLPQDILSLSGMPGGGGRPDMVTSVMADMMMSMRELQQSFSMYLGGGLR
jgi:hypothetical protein